MCEFCGSSSSEAFFEKLVDLLSCPNRLPIGPYHTLAMFRDDIYVHSVEYVLPGGQRQWGRINNFGQSWSTEDLKWLIRHLANTPEDMIKARNLMVAKWQKMQEEQEKRFPFYGLKTVPI